MYMYSPSVTLGRSMDSKSHGSTWSICTTTTRETARVVSDPQDKREHVKLTSFSKIRVDLAAQVLYILSSSHSVMSY